jgi:hypothetical protein
MSTRNENTAAYLDDTAEAPAALPDGPRGHPDFDLRVLAAEAQGFRRAVADLEGAADWLRGAYVEELIRRSLLEGAARAASPWLDRAGAAAHCRCSPSEIDRAANRGVFKRYTRCGTPLFKRAELDAAIESGNWVRAGQAKGAPASQRAGANTKRK